MVEIFVEGKVDYEFITFILTNFYSKKIKVDFDIIPLNSWNGFIKLTSRFNQILENKDNLVLFLDADKPNKDNNGGFNNRKKYIENWFNKNIKNIHYNFYLFPDNSSDGEIEDLLLKLLNSKNNNLLKCFDEYVNCISISNQFLAPSSKDKVYGVISALEKGKTNIEIENKKKGNYYFNDNNIWNINKSNSELNSLFEFLTQLF